MSNKINPETGGVEAWMAEIQARNLAMQQFEAERKRYYNERIIEESRPFRSKLGGYLEKLGGYLLKGSAAFVLTTGILLVANIATSDPETILNHPIRQVALPIFKYSLLGTSLGAWIDTLGVAIKCDNNCISNEVGKIYHANS